jgi:hypothetical protein
LLFDDDFAGIGLPVELHDEIFRLTGSPLLSNSIEPMMSLKPLIRASRLGGLGVRWLF